MAEIRSMVSTSSRHFDVLFYNIIFISITPLVIVFQQIAKWDYKGCRGY